MQTIQNCLFLSVVLTVFSCATPLAGGPFVPGNPVVLRVYGGDWEGSVTNNISSRVLLEEYGKSARVQSIAIPTSGVDALLLTANAVAEGALSRAPNSRWIAFGGYHCPLGLNAVPTSSSLVNPRVVGVIDAYGRFKVVADQTNFFNGLSLRTVATDGTNDFWAAGAVSATGSGGLVYHGYSSPPTVIDPGNRRVASIINGRLHYTFAHSTAGGLYRMSGLPKTPGAGVLLISNTNSPYGFAINASETIAYLADDTRSSIGGLQRYTNSAGGWRLAYTLGTGVTNTGARGLAVDWSGPNPLLYATTGENSVFGNPSNRLVRVEDTGPDSVALTLAVSDGKSSFRGVALAPEGSSPDPGLARLEHTGNDICVRWSGLAGRSYVVQAAAILTDSAQFVDVSSPVTVCGHGVSRTTNSDSIAFAPLMATNMPAPWVQ